MIKLVNLNPINPSMNEARKEGDIEEEARVFSPRAKKINIYSRWMNWMLYIFPCLIWK